MREPILFISTMAGAPFGGSEELWTQTAALLAKRGVAVAASVHGWPQLDQRISELSHVGVDLRPRPVKRSLFSRARRYMSGKAQFAFDIEQSFGSVSPDLVVISSGSANPPIELAEMLVAREWPFVTIANTMVPTFWPSDEMVAKIRKVMPFAQRCFFVSEANRDLAEKQWGFDIENAEIVRNPLNVKIDSPIPWPSDVVDQELRMASVGRLSGEKGLDILLEVLAAPSWKGRKWRLTLYGKGPLRGVLELLVRRLKLQDRVSFGGYAEIEKIWRENHILAMPSRFEGMPLAIVEAMFCGRPVVATNVGGVPEVVKDDVTGFLADAAVPKCFGEALERMWARRDHLEEMGRLAATDIREIMPADPVGIFAKIIEDLAGHRLP